MPKICQTKIYFTILFCAMNCISFEKEILFFSDSLAHICNWAGNLYLSPLSPPVKTTVENHSFIEHFGYTRAHGKKCDLFLSSGQSVSHFLVFTDEFKTSAVVKLIERKRVFNPERLMDQKQTIESDFSIYLSLLTADLFYVWQFIEHPESISEFWIRAAFTV